MKIERTFVMIKPDGIQRGLVGRIIQRFEDRTMKIAALKLINVQDVTAAEHYKEHVGKDFYQRLLDYIKSGPVVCMVIEGPDAVDQVRKMVGKTHPGQADVSTIRHDFGQDISRNIIHAADSRESADREIGIYFDDHEILDYNLDVHHWVFAE